MILMQQDKALNPNPLWLTIGEKGLGCHYCSLPKVAQFRKGCCRRPARVATHSGRRTQEGHTEEVPTVGSGLWGMNSFLKSGNSMSKVTKVSL